MSQKDAEITVLSRYQVRGWAIPGMLLAVLILVPPIVGMLSALFLFWWLALLGGTDGQVEGLFVVLRLGALFGLVLGWPPALLTVVAAGLMALFRRKLTFWPMAVIGLIASFAFLSARNFPFAFAHDGGIGFGLVVCAMTVGIMGLVWWLGRLIGWVRREAI